MFTLYFRTKNKATNLCCHVKQSNEHLDPPATQTLEKTFANDTGMYAVKQLRGIKINDVGLKKSPCMWQDFLSRRVRVNARGISASERASTNGQKKLRKAPIGTRFVAPFVRGKHRERDAHSDWRSKAFAGIRETPDEGANRAMQTRCRSGRCKERRVRAFATAQPTVCSQPGFSFSRALSCLCAAIALAPATTI